MEIIGIFFWLIVIWLALSFSWGVRKNTWSGLGVTIQSTNMAMLFMTQIIVVTTFGLNPLHFLWMIPAAFILGSMSIIFPFTLISQPGWLYGNLCCLGLDKEVITQNKVRLDYARQLISCGHSQDEATRMALEKFPAKKTQTNLDDMHQEGQNVTQDYKHRLLDGYIKAAEQGDINEQYALGIIYSHGQGVTQDYGQAVYWYGKAAAQGHADAQTSLGLMYEDGKGVTQDYKQAVDWYTKAAVQGHTHAQYSLGLMYEDGKGVTQNYVQAVDWLKIAATHGHQIAQDYLDIMYKKETVNQNIKQAAEGNRKAAEQGDANAQNNLGVMYANGQGVIQDDKKAFDWYKKAAVQGQVEAQFNLGFMFYQGKGITQDYKQAAD